MKIIFDLSGVLLRWQPHDLLARLLPEHATTLEATQALVLDFFQGFGGDWGEFDRGTLDAAPLAERISRRTSINLRDVRHVIDVIPQELQPVAASVDLLRRLHADGRELYFLSNMPEPYARHLETTHAFFTLFRHGVFSARVRSIKPEAAIFAHAQAAFGVGDLPPLFIDDVFDNVNAARAMGWRAIHFQDVVQCQSELAALGLM
ncbi:MAG: HAD-IA family hydrolase [Burkholderiaceae bacterium]